MAERKTTSTPRTPPKDGPVDAVARALFPSTLGMIERSGTQIDDYLAQGQTARAIGAGLRPAVLAAPMLANDVVGRPAATIGRGIGNAVAGLFGSDGSTTVAPRVAAPVVAKPVEAALAAGRAAEATPITPQDRALAYIDTVLRGPVTQREAASVLGALPGVIKPAVKPQTAKDAVFGTAASTSDAIYKAQLATAQQLAAGTARDTAIQKATDSYFQRNAGLVGFDPTKLAQAQLLSGEEQP